MPKVALVTGGTRGIGAAVSEALHAAGYRVAASYAGNVDAAHAFESRTGIATFRWDVADFDACQDGVKVVEEALGPVDVLVNNAGITRDRSAHKMSPQEWLAVINTNLNGAFYMCNAVLGGMRARRFGRIINMSSINGQKGQFGQANYSAAKAGLLGLTRALAQESAKYGITVNAVAPGHIDTEMLHAAPPQLVAALKAQIPMDRLGTVEEVAHSVLFLADEKAAFITGSTISINGGNYFV
ncbi:MAG: acetoacetyl CoA reductase [Herminiimonas sp.]|jgi:acetoacetyl-CoA reductase|nr:acetoacetyl CoA reductase [Herminiimonas sp.]